MKSLNLYYKTRERLLQKSKVVILGPYWPNEQGYKLLRKIQNCIISYGFKNVFLVEDINYKDLDLDEENQRRAEKYNCDKLLLERVNMNASEAKECSAYLIAKMKSSLFYADILIIVIPEKITEKISQGLLIELTELTSLLDVRSIIIDLYSTINENIEKTINKIDPNTIIILDDPSITQSLEKK